jgi:hypothetical protein
MTYYDAALEVLKSVRRPLTAREITDEAIVRGLITPVGKTPLATMKAELYHRVRSDPDLVKIQDLADGRAKRNSVRWALRNDART